MGIWGLDLYQNDTSLDVKGEFEELYNASKTVQDITDILVFNYNRIMGDDREEPLFWFALADIQWNLGVLLPVVREKALYWIDKDSAAFRSLTIDEPKRTMRKRVLDDLRVKLLSPQPPKKKPTGKRIYKCQWELGDVFAYRLESDLAKARGLYGRYFLVQKIDEDIWYPGHVIPIVYVKITRDVSIPSNVEEYNQLEFVQMWFTKYEDRFWPIDMRRPQEDIAEKSEINYQVDEYGFLPQYRAKLLNTSKRVIPAKLIYVGNFASAAWPQKEFIPYSKGNIVTVPWKQFHETFETKLIKRYCEHNLRELSIYAAKST